MYKPASNNPGKIAAANNLRGDNWAITEYTINIMLGGINIPKQPPEHITPDANFLSYPALIIAGQANNPIKVTTAPIIPVAVENNAQVISAATAIEAGSLCEASLIAKNNLETIPALSTRYPINKNNGTAVSTVLSITV